MSLAHEIKKRLMMAEAFKLLCLSVILALLMFSRLFQSQFVHRDLLLPSLIVLKITSNGLTKIPNVSTRFPWTGAPLIMLRE